MNERGQAALAMVFGIVMLLVTGGTLLAANTMQHDPLVQADVVTHYAYRALESGVNSYLTTINANPMIVTCSTATTRQTCRNTAATTRNYYDNWTQVPNTTTSAGSQPEWYLWTNPQLCFSSTATHATACTSAATSGNFEYLQVLIIGAAGTPGHYQYQSSVANFEPTNGFLTHLWWSNYESAPNPTKAKTAHVTPTICKYNWKNGHTGPGNTCSPINFGSPTHIDGPVFSNDSIYTYGTPFFGTATSGAKSTVSTGDSSCLFVNSTGQCRTSGGISYTATNSHIGMPKERPPKTDTELETVAAQHGCVYTGPTTISFYTTSSATPGSHQGYMLVTSPETKATSTGRLIAKPTRGPNNKTICLSSTPAHKAIPVPSGTSGNGVIFVKTGPAAGASCTTAVNPFEGKRATQTKLRSAAQIVVGSYNYTNDSVTGKSVNCEGDVFVRDTDPGSNGNTPSGYVRGMAGNLTVAAENNVVITGTLTYADCTTTWNSTSTCPYHPGAKNDSLGLIANNFVEVNRPVKPASGCPNQQLRYCPYTDGTGEVLSRYGYAQWTPETHCSTTVTDVQAALCNPGPNLTIDAALLDLKHSFVVNNYKARNPTTNLIIYGAIDQYWRGAVGLLNGYGTVTTGYAKYYTWDSRLQYLSIPAFLTPGTPSWALASSSVVMSSNCPGWPQPYGTAGLITPVKTMDPSGTPSACSGALPT